MPSKSTPRWQWERGIDRASNPFTKEDIQNIQNIIDIKLTEEQKQCITNAAVNFISNIHFFIDRPKNSEKRSAFDLIKRRAFELAHYLEVLDSDSLHSLAENIGGFDFLENLKNSLFRLHFAAKISMKELPTKGGHPEEIARKLFILELKEIFDEKIGITPGKFVILVYSCLKILSKKRFCDPPSSTEAIDKAIRSIRKQI